MTGDASLKKEVIEESVVLFGGHHVKTGSSQIGAGSGHRDAVLVHQLLEEDVEGDEDGGSRDT